VCQNNGFFADRSFRIDVAWPLFDGFRAKGNLDLAQAQARTAELQLAQTRERVAVEAAQARALVERARALYAAQRANAADAEEAFRLATLRFQRGLGTQLEVSDAQLALLTAQTNALRATYDVYLAAAEQARALGRPIPTP
jgi:outer membrane protein TolC